jgi:type IV secretion system protein TrbI
MSNFLTKTPKIDGLSRNKIIFFSFVVIGVVLSLMIFGVFSDDGGNDIKPQDMSAEAKYDHVDTNASIEHIINTANDDKDRVLASTALKQKKIETQDNTSIPPIEKTLNKQIVPLKNLNVNPIKTKYTEGLEMKKYDSYSSKSLVYSKPLFATNNDTNDDKSITTNQLKSSSDNIAGNVIKNSTSNNLSGGSGNIQSTNDNDQNQQGEKQRFLKSGDDDKSRYLDSKLTVAKSPYLVNAGSIIPATMISGLNSDLPGQIIGQVRQNVYDSSTRRYLLIPQGSKLVGLYDSHIPYGQERVLVIWNRLIYPNGDSINLRGMPGTDIEGYAGFHDIVDNKYWQIFGTSFIMGVITGAMQYSQNNTNPNVQVGGLGLSTNPSMSQTMSGSLGQQLGQTGLSVAQKNLNVQPTLIIRPGYPFNIMITADMELKPYGKP